MKKIKVTLFLAILGLLFASCKTDIVQPVVSSSPTSPGQVNLTYTGQFNINYADSLVTFSWSAANFGFQSSTTYNVQITPDSSFTNNVKTIITIDQKLTGTAKVGDINAILLTWNYAAGTNVKVYYRVAASVSQNVDTVFSSASSTIVAPYSVIINYPMIYVPGAYQGWSPGAVNGRLFSYGFDSQYSGIIRIIDTTNATSPSDFKIAPAPNWDNSWGGTLVQSGNNYTGTLDASGGNFTVNPACYVIDVDVNALTISLTKTDDWGIIGDFNGWSTSMPMFYDGQRKMWEITGDFTAGGFKFRANNDWALNYGDTGADGTLDAGGDNIQIAAAGNYTIRADFVAKTYTITQN